MSNPTVPRSWELEWVICMRNERRVLQRLHEQGNHGGGPWKMSVPQLWQICFHRTTNPYLLHHQRQRRRRRMDSCKSRMIDHRVSCQDSANAPSNWLPKLQDLTHREDNNKARFKNHRRLIRQCCSSKELIRWQPMRLLASRDGEPWRRIRLKVDLRLVLHLVPQ